MISVLVPVFRVPLEWFSQCLASIEYDLACLESAHPEQPSAEVVIVNDLPAAEGGNKGHAVGLASARERVQAMTDGRGRIDAAVEEGRFVVRMHLPA